MRSLVALCAAMPEQAASVAPQTLVVLVSLGRKASLGCVPTQSVGTRKK